MITLYYILAHSLQHSMFNVYCLMFTVEDLSICNQSNMYANNIIKKCVDKIMLKALCVTINR